MDPSRALRGARACRHVTVCDRLSTFGSNEAGLCVEKGTHDRAIVETDTTRSIQTLRLERTLDRIAEASRVAST
jgi:hypothetical protein